MHPHARAHTYTVIHTRHEVRRVSEKAFFSVPSFKQKNRTPLCSRESDRKSACKMKKKAASYFETMIFLNLRFRWGCRTSLKLSAVHIQPHKEGRRGHLRAALANGTIWVFVAFPSYTFTFLAYSAASMMAIKRRQFGLF